MTMINCHECGHQVSSEAAACVKCGAPIKPNPAAVAAGNFARRHAAAKKAITLILAFGAVGIGAIVVISIGVSAMSSPNAEQQSTVRAPKPSPTVPAISAEEKARTDRLMESCATRECPISQDVTIRHLETNTPGCMDIDVAAYMQTAVTGAFIAHKPVLTPAELGHLATQNGYNMAGIRCTLVEDGKQGRVVNVASNLILVTFGNYMASLWLPAEDMKPGIVQGPTVPIAAAATAASPDSDSASATASAAAPQSANEPDKASAPM